MSKQRYVVQNGRTELTLHDGVSKIFRTVRLERELQMVQLSANRCNCIATLWVSLVSFTAISICVVPQLVFIIIIIIIIVIIIIIYFVIDSVRKLLDTSSYV
jgi:hypothetical protein